MFQRMIFILGLFLLSISFIFAVDSSVETLCVGEVITYKDLNFKLDSVIYIDGDYSAKLVDVLTFGYMDIILNPNDDYSVCNINNTSDHVIITFEKFNPTTNCGDFKFEVYKDGCLSSNFKCVETDSGLDFNKKGTTTGIYSLSHYKGIKEFSDTCTIVKAGGDVLESKYIKEFFCDDDGFVYVNYNDCNCYDGQCISGNIETQDNNKFNSLNISFKKGWNLYPLPNSDSFGSVYYYESDFIDSRITHIFLYLPLDKEYFDLIPYLDATKTMNFDELKKLANNMKYITTAWYYSTEDFETNIYSLDQENYELKDLDAISNKLLNVYLKDGWNFVNLPKPFYDKYGSGIESKQEFQNLVSENCKVDSIYFWSNLFQNWINAKEQGFILELINIDNRFNGSLIKVSGDCSLSIPKSNINPPSLPK